MNEDLTACRKPVADYRVSLLVAATHQQLSVDSGVRSDRAASMIDPIHGYLPTKFYLLFSIRQKSQLELLPDRKSVV